RGGTAPPRRGAPAGRPPRPRATRRPAAGPRRAGAPRCRAGSRGRRRPGRARRRGPARHAGPGRDRPGRTRTRAHRACRCTSRPYGGGRAAARCGAPGERSAAQARGAGGRLPSTLVKGFSESFNSRHYAGRGGRMQYPQDPVPDRPKRRATIRELAEYTGLSQAAVSYALRGMQVSAETEERVRAAAEELGYEADPIARALRGGASGVVGLLVGSLADFWNQELMHAVQRELRQADRGTLVADADGEPERELELARRLVDHRVDGLTVTIGDALPGVTALGEVVFANDEGLEATLRHLGALGHRRVAVLSWAVETS